MNKNIFDILFILNEVKIWHIFQSQYIDTSHQVFKAMLAIAFQRLHRDAPFSLESKFDITNLYTADARIICLDYRCCMSKKYLSK